MTAGLPVSSAPPIRGSSPSPGLGMPYSAHRPTARAMCKGWRPCGQVSTYVTEPGQRRCRNFARSGCPVPRPASGLSARACSNRCAPVRRGLLPLPSEYGFPPRLKGTQIWTPPLHVRGCPKSSSGLPGRYNRFAGCWLRQGPSSSDTRRFCGLGAFRPAFCPGFIDGPFAQKSLLSLLSLHSAPSLPPLPAPCPFSSQPLSALVGRALLLCSMPIFLLKLSASLRITLSHSLLYAQSQVHRGAQ